MRRSFYFSLVIVCLASGAGCIRVGLHPRMTLSVDIAPDANRNKPVGVDLVEIDDKDLAKDVEKMTAADWFQKREQIRQDFPRAKSITIADWEWTPGQVVPDIKVPMRRRPRVVLIFANYDTPGSHRAKLDPAKPAAIHLERDDVKVEVAEKQKLAKSLAK